MKLTPGRKLWLETLLKGPGHRSRGPQGYHCMAAGWTEWDYRTPEGEPITGQEARERYGSEWWNVVAGKSVAERITEKGRKVLANQTDETDDGL